MALCSFNVKTKSKGKKNVLMLYNDASIIRHYERDDGKKKPAICKLYDFTKGRGGGGDIVDQKISYYTTKAKSSKWNMVAFYFILDTTMVNALTILALKEKKNPRNIDSFEIGFELVMSLVRPQLERRRRNGLQKNIIRKIDLFIDQNDNDEDDEVHKFLRLGDKRRNRTACLDVISGPQCKQKKSYCMFRCYWWATM